MESAIPLGKKQIIDGQLRVYYYGYWIKAYEAPADTLLAKERLIEALTRRPFNHVEHGIHVPGKRLDEARLAFESETDPQRKRVKAATAWPASSRTRARSSARRCAPTTKSSRSGRRSSCRRRSSPASSRCSARMPRPMSGSRPPGASS